MSYFAYHRVSTKQQKLDRGLDEIEKFCKERGKVLFLQISKVEKPLIDQDI